MTTINPITYWEEVSNQLGGTFTLTKQSVGLSHGVGMDLYHLRILTKHKDFSIEMYSTFERSPSKFEEFYLGNKLVISSTLKNQDEFYLIFWRRGFFEKIFLTKDMFNQQIGFKTNKKNLVKSMLLDEKLQNILTTQSTSLFHISSENAELTITLKLFSDYDSSRSILMSYQDFTYFLDRLQLNGLIKNSL